MSDDETITQEKTADPVEQLGHFLEQNNLISLIELHGFLTAIVSAPNMTMPSQWMDYLKLNQQDFSSKDQAQAILGMVMSMYNEIAENLHNQTFEIFDPNTNEDEETELEAKRWWAYGYMLAVHLDKASWRDSNISEPLSMISCLAVGDQALQDTLQNAFAKDGAEDNVSLDEQAQTLRNICNDKAQDAAIQIYNYWAQQRAASAKDNKSSSKRKNKTGRNDPCPCGSGKKYKKCCLS